MLYQTIVFLELNLLEIAIFLVFMFIILAIDILVTMRFARLNLNKKSSPTQWKIDLDLAL